MVKPLCNSDPKEYPIGNQADEITEYLKIAFLVRDNLEKLFNSSQNLGCNLLNNGLKDYSSSQNAELKKNSERVVQIIMWSEPCIKDVSILRWNIRKKGFPICDLLIKLYNYKPLRLHLRVNENGKIKVEFWTYRF